MVECSIPTPEVVGLIRFHGMTMWTVEHDGNEYIYAKPLVDVAGLDWRRAKRTISESDNATLYGTKTLNHPVFASLGGPRTPNPQHGLYIRLDRARIFLARIQTNQMRAQGNIDAANALLELQIEWAGVLHNYETQGYALKTERTEARRKSEATLAALFKVRGATTDATEKAALTRMIHDKMADLGYPVDQVEDPQQSLPLQ